MKVDRRGEEGLARWAERDGKGIRHEHDKIKLPSGSICIVHATCYTTGYIYEKSLLDIKKEKVCITNFFIFY